MLSKVIIETENNKKAIIQLRRIIEEKTKVSYLGELYSQSSIKELFKRLKRFHDWAGEILER